MFIIKLIINIPTTLILFLRIICFENWFKNFKKIFLSDIIIFHTDGGFGHQIEINDIARNYYKNKKILYICKFNKERNNAYIAQIFGNECINIQTSLNVKILKKEFSIGEYEGSKIRIIENFLLLLIKIFTNKKIITNVEFYKILSKIYKQAKKTKKIHKYDYVNFYYKLLKENKKPLTPSLLPQDIKKKFKKFKKKFKNKKVCLVYVKYTNKNVKDFTKVSRSGSSNIHYYYPLFDFLLKKNFNLLIFGDVDYKIKNNINYEKKIFTNDCFSFDKDLFDIFSILLIPEIFIGECGGPLYLGFYAKKSLGINWFPYGYIPPEYNLVIRKKIYDQKKRKFLTEKSCEKKFYWKYDLGKRYKIELNDNYQILRSLKKVLRA
tara:strand:+ start:20081 stop:21217 length:1137 start_codon:yes stop_codon:yes gene_type:complete